MIIMEVLILNFKSIHYAVAGRALIWRETHVDQDLFWILPMFVCNLINNPEVEKNCTGDKFTSQSARHRLLVAVSPCIFAINLEYIVRTSDSFNTRYLNTP